MFVPFLEESTAHQSVYGFIWPLVLETLQYVVFHIVYLMKTLVDEFWLVEFISAVPLMLIWHNAIRNPQCKLTQIWHFWPDCICSQNKLRCDHFLIFTNEKLIINPSCKISTAKYKDIFRGMLFGTVEPSLATLKEHVTPSSLEEILSRSTKNHNFLTFMQWTVHCLLIARYNGNQSIFYRSSAMSIYLLLWYTFVLAHA